MPLLTALILLTAAANPGPPRLASSGFSHVNLDDKTADFFDEFFAQQLQGEGVPVTTQSAVATLVGLERQRQLLGCSEEDSSCLAELAGALGVEGVVVGNLAKFGAEYVITVKLVSAKDATTVFSESGRMEGDKALLDWLTRTAKRLAVTLRPKETAAPVAQAPASAVTAAPSGPSAPAPRGSSRLGAWIAAGSAAALGVGSGGTYLLSWSRYEALRTGSDRLETPAHVQAAGTQGRQLQWASVGLGAAAVAAAGVSAWLFLSAGAPAAVTVAPAEGGAAVLFEGRFQ